MNKLKLVALKIDDMHLAFKDGLNYIVGKNASGKTTIFNCIRYVIGLSKFNESSNVYSISLRACIDDNQLTFSRDAGDTEISISINDECHRFRPMSKELNDFLCEQLQPDYIFGREYENIFSLLNFFFLSFSEPTPAMGSNKFSLRNKCFIAGLFRKRHRFFKERG